MNLNETHIVIERSNGTLALMAFQTAMRSATPPTRGGWQGSDGHYWRLPDASNVQAEVDRLAQGWAADGITIVGWHHASPEEVAKFNADRPFRNALRRTPDGRVEHDMPAAREGLRTHIRKHRASAMPALDGQWMRATGQGDKAAAKAVEAERQRWRDAPADPRIDAAGSVDDLRALLP